MHAFILAGGFATRLWPLTEKRAKPLLPLAGKPMLTHIVEKIPENIPITVSTNAAFEDGFKIWKESLHRKDVTIAIEQTTHDDKKLGTNGAVAQWIAQTNLADDLLLLTGDNYLGFSMDAFLQSCTPDHALLAAYDVGSLEEASRFGTVLTAKDHATVTGFEEKPKEPKTTLVSTGCYVIPQSFLPIVSQYAKTHPDHIGGIFEEFLRHKKPVSCFTFQEPWFDIGSFEAYLDATRTLVGEAVHMEEGSTLTTTKSSGSIVIGESCTVQNSELRDVVLFDNCIVEDCVLERCIIDNHCVLRGIDLNGKMLREGTRLVRNL